jgi:hypothetical protein
MVPGNEQPVRAKPRARVTEMRLTDREVFMKSSRYPYFGDGYVYAVTHFSLLSVEAKSIAVSALTGASQETLRLRLAGGWITRTVGRAWLWATIGRS